MTNPNNNHGTHTNHSTMTMAHITTHITWTTTATSVHRTFSVTSTTHYEHNPNLYSVIFSHNVGNDGKPFSVDVAP